MNISLFSKKCCLLSLVLLSVGSISTMKKGQREQQRINNAAQENLTKATPTQYVRVSPNAHVSLQIAANNHNKDASQGKK